MNIPDNILQVAIDAAFNASVVSPLTTFKSGYPLNWKDQAPARLAIARAFLAALPRRPDHCVEADQKAEPWTLPAPPAGRRWHREDWTADMLPEGFRPLLEGEAWTLGDEIRRTGSSRWDVAGQHGFDIIGKPTTGRTAPCRTRRPLPAAEPPATFEAHGKVWTRHTPGDPCPCYPDAKVEVLFEDSGEADSVGWAFASAWIWEKHGKTDSIIGWRYADLAPAAPTEAAEDIKREPAAQPWTPKPGDVVRLKSGGPEMTVMDEEENGEFWCLWFDPCGNKDCLDFPAACLTPAKEGQP